MRRGDRPFTCPLGAGGLEMLGRNDVFSLWVEKVMFFRQFQHNLFFFFFGGGLGKRTKLDFTWLCQVELCIFSVSWWVGLGVGMWKACYLHTYAVHMYNIYTIRLIIFDCFPLNWSPIILRRGGKNLNLWSASLDVSLVGVGTVSRGPSRAVWVGRFPTRIEWRDDNTTHVDLKFRSFFPWAFHNENSVLVI